MPQAVTTKGNRQNPPKVEAIFGNCPTAMPKKRSALQDGESTVDGRQQRYPDAGMKKCQQGRASVQRWHWVATGWLVDSFEARRRRQPRQLPTVHIAACNVIVNRSRAKVGILKSTIFLSFFGEYT
jgi:hypothetical protein